MSRTWSKIVYFWSLTLFFCHDCLGAGLNKLPLIDAKTLNKNSFSVPKDFTLNRNVLLISFGRDMQSAIDDWARELEFLEGSAESFMVYNMPLIPNPGALVRGFINRGFRSLYKDKEVRE